MSNVRDRIKPGAIKRRQVVDSIFKALFTAAGVLSALMIIIIFVFVGWKGVAPFLPVYGGEQQSIWSFISGMTWRPDQNPALYGVLFIVINTLISAFLAALVSFPVSVLTALFIVKIAPRPLRAFFTTVVEMLAAVPSVVYGVFASGQITKIVDTVAGWFGKTTFGGNSLLTVSILLAIMIFPTITVMSITSISAVDRNLELGSLALGASRTQTNFKVVLSAAKSGIFAGLVLGLGRAFGEATAVSMVAGNAMTGPTWNLFDITRTLTSAMLSGLKETTGLDYDIRFSVGIILMIIVLLTNLAIQYIKRKIGGVTND